MIRANPLIAALLTVCLVLGATRRGRAEPASVKARPVYVLSIWTDDADDQSDALTQALRSRVRQARGWSLLETSQSFETLAIALKCPPKPDPACLQRIGDQLRTDQYVWGTVARNKASATVNAELHYWVRGKPGAETVETYSDNLRDANDEPLRAIAASIFGRLTGAGPATFVVHAGAAGGAVLIDGVELAQLDGGMARLDVSAGPHTVAVRIPGFDTTAQTAKALPGAEQDMTFPLGTFREGDVPEWQAKPFPLRQVVAYSAVVAGAGFLVAAAIEAAIWWDDRSKSHDDRLSVPRSVSDVCIDQVNAAAVDACRKGRDAINASTLAWIFGGVGAAVVGGGVYLLVVHHRETTDGQGQSGGWRGERKPTVAVSVTPEVVPRGAGLRLGLTF